MTFHLLPAECLLDDPAAGFVRGRAYITVLGDRQISAVGVPQGEHTVAPVDERQLGRGVAARQRRKVGAAGEERRVEGAFRALAGAGAGVGIGDPQPARRALQAHQVGALREGHPVRAEPGPHSVERGGPVDQRAAVPVELAGIGEQADDRDRPGRPGVERQQTVVLQQDHGLFGGLLGERPVFGRVEGGGVRVRVETGVELPQRVAQFEQAADGGVDVGLVEEALLQCAADPAGHDGGVLAVVGEAVDSGLQRCGRGLFVGVEVVLGVDQVGRRPGVGADHERLLGPASQLLGQERRDMVGPPVDQVVGGHDPCDRARTHGVAERPEVVLVQHPRADRRGGGVPVGLVVVGEPVLEHRGGAPVVRVVAAQSAGICDGDRGGQGCVLRVPLLAAPPQRMAQQIHGRGPDVEADPVILGPLGPDLVADCLADPAHQVVVPSGAQADGLREDGGGAHPGHAVQSLLAGAEGADPEPVDRGCELVQHRDPLVEGEPLEQIVDAPSERQLRVAEGLRLFRHVRVPLERWKVLRCPGLLSNTQASDDLSKRFDALRQPPRVSRVLPRHSRSTGLDHAGKRLGNRSEESGNGLLCLRCPSLNLAATSKRFDRVSMGRRSPAISSISRDGDAFCHRVTFLLNRFTQAGSAGSTGPSGATGPSGSTSNAPPQTQDPNGGRPPRVVLVRLEGLTQ